MSRADEARARIVTVSDALSALLAHDALLLTPEEAGCLRQARTILEQLLADLTPSRRQS